MYTYDSLNRLKTIKELEGRIIEYAYDKIGNRTNQDVTFSSQKTTTFYQYDEQKRLISTSIKINDKTRVTKYTYDENGNVTSKIAEIIKKIEPSNPSTQHFRMFIPGQAEGGVTKHAKDLSISTGKDANLLSFELFAKIMI